MHAILKKQSIATILILMVTSVSFGQNRTRWVSVKEIYAQGKHNAWPDMCRWRDKYYIVFPANAAGHAENHDVVVLESQDADQWEIVLDTPSSDWVLEEDETWPAETLFFMPTKERLYLLYWASARGNTEVSAEKKQELKKEWMALGGTENSWRRWVERHEQSYRTRVRYTTDGRTWSDPEELLEPRWWIWRPQTFRNKHYMIGFTGEDQQWEITPDLKPMIPLADELPLGRKRGWGIELFRAASLFTSDNGRDWTQVSHVASNDDGESGLAFRPDGLALVMSRNGAGGKHAIAYTSHPPYQQWKKFQLNQTIHQAAVIYHKGRWIISGRGMDETTLEPNRFDPENSIQCRYGTPIWFFNDKTGELTKATSLPSWGDCGQPAFLPTPEGDLLVAYYSCSERIDRNRYAGGGPHPGKYSPASIYLARVVID